MNIIKVMFHRGIIDCNDRGEDSVRGMEGVKVYRAHSWEKLVAAYWYLRLRPHGFQTVSLTQ